MHHFKPRFDGVLFWVFANFATAPIPTCAGIGLFPLSCCSPTVLGVLLCPQVGRYVFAVASLHSRVGT